MLHEEKLKMTKKVRLYKGVCMQGCMCVIDHQSEKNPFSSLTKISARMLSHGS